MGMRYHLLLLLQRGEMSNLLLLHTAYSMFSIIIKTSVYAHSAGSGVAFVC